jgi:hypothetical protein
VIDAPPQNYADAFEYALPVIWNSGQDRVRFSEMRCHRAGRVHGRTVFICKTLYTDRVTGEERRYKFTLLAWGEVIGMQRMKHTPTRT